MSHCRQGSTGGRRRGGRISSIRILHARALLALSITAALGLVLPAASADASARPCSSGLVALTFDDGPATGLTPKLLDILTSRRVPATFFMVGERIDSAPDAARQVAARGFAIANHSYHHEQLTKLSDSAIRTTIRRTRRAADHAGVPMSRLVRPPYGAMERGCARSLRAWGSCRCSGRSTLRTGAAAAPPTRSPRACSPS